MSEERSPYETRGPDFEAPGQSSPTPPAQDVAAEAAHRPEPQPSPGPEPVTAPYVDPRYAPFQQSQAQPYGAQPQPYQPQAHSAPQPHPGYAGGWGPLPEHPRSTTVLILGILGFVFAIPAFFGWYMGAKARKEVRSGAPYRWDGALKVGYILSIIASVLTIAGVVLYLFLLFVLFATLGAM